MHCLHVCVKVAQGGDPGSTRRRQKPEECPPLPEYLPLFAPYALNACRFEEIPCAIMGYYLCSSSIQALMTYASFPGPWRPACEKCTAQEERQPLCSTLEDPRIFLSLALFYTYGQRQANQKDLSEIPCRVYFLMSF